MDSLGRRASARTNCSRSWGWPDRLERRCFPQSWYPSSWHLAATKGRGRGEHSARPSSYHTLFGFRCETQPSFKNVRSMTLNARRGFNASSAVNNPLGARRASRRAHGDRAGGRQAARVALVSGRAAGWRGALARERCGGRNGDWPKLRLASKRTLTTWCTARLTDTDPATVDGPGDRRRQSSSAERRAGQQSPAAGWTSTRARQVANGYPSETHAAQAQRRGCQSASS